MEHFKWRESNNSLSILATQVHVWRIWLDVSSAQYQQLYAKLSKLEKDLAERKHRNTQKRQYVAAHGRSREILSRYLHIQPEDIVLNLNAYGRPSLEPKHNPQGLTFNLSHSDTVALLAVSAGFSVGVDLEHTTREIDHEGIAKRFFSAREIDELLSVAESHHKNAFFTYWTLKEAYIKALGVGMALPLNQFEVSFLHGQDEIHVLESHEDMERKPWLLYQLEPMENYIGALAVNGRPGEISAFTCWGWPEGEDYNPYT